MDSALAWVGQLAEWFGRFIPRWQIVRTTHGAVKFVRGSKAVALGPGLHWYWPLITEFVEYPIVRQAVDLPTQTVVTSDGRVLAAGGIIVYEVKDIVALVAHTFSPDQAVRDITLTSIHDVICRRTWAEIQEQQQSGILERDLRREAARELDRYGLKVLKATLTDLAPCRVYKLIQASTSDGVG